MNDKEKIIVETIIDCINSGWDKGKEKRIHQIADEVNWILYRDGYFFTVTPKLVGSYLRRFLSIETERRGNKNHTYPIVLKRLANNVSK